VGATCRPAAWYERVLGFRRVDEFAAPDGPGARCSCATCGLAARLGLTQHRDDPARFDETRVGLDHLASA
jgi:catechol 2,3-dioxygenase-like lactoylglutathione lyase family enzyme